MKITSRGFTLIELLVVVAIVSLLSSVVLASVRESRIKANASAQRTYMKEVVKALELYKLEYGNYPGQEIAGTQTHTMSTLFSSYPALANYIQNNSNPSSGLGYLPANALYVEDPLPQTYNCGFDGSSGDPYYIRYTLNRNDLQIPKIYTVTGSYGLSTQDNWYCASLSVN
jgi:prepilin-type N-terminal cleavage/methylation domain-containing protein